MSLWCFCLSRRRSDQARTRMLFQEQFERIKGVYPGTSYMCLLDGESGGMMCSEALEVNTDEFTRTIINLKDAALQFGAFVAGMACMDVGFPVAEACAMPGVDLELFDCFEADKGIELITAELRRIVDANQVNLRRN
ncbi:hypothetical protein BBJ28_00022932 [Nothophytophthora sp. Chile5]|nr:hypothetical protein BBJ28_00022932 [Nothophytophthora sp. Chile5]